LLSVNGSCCLIGEVAQAHGTSVDFAHAYIDMASELGLDAIKFQYRRAEIEGSRQESFRVKPKWRRSLSRYEYWKENEFNTYEWLELRDHAQEIGLLFGVSFFSLPVLDEVCDLNVDFLKIASPEFGEEGFIESTLSMTTQPVIASTGMSNNRQINEIIPQLLKIPGTGERLTVLQCTSKYPCAIEEVGVSVMSELVSLGVKSGLSYHGSSIWPPVYAIAKGASCVELHLQFSSFQGGPDSESSLVPKQISQLVSARDSFRLLDAEFDKDLVFDQIKDTRTLFAKSVGLKTSLPAGHILRDTDLTPRRPGTGIPWADKDTVIGRRLLYDWDYLDILEKKGLE
jgi:N,N'-diacetyllegionaminate synthase